MTHEIYIMVAVNNQIGNRTRYCRRVDFSIKGEVEPILNIECDGAGRGIPFNHDERTFELAGEPFNYLGYRSCVGNIFWDSYLITPKTAALIANHLHKLGAMVESGWAEFFDKWIDGGVFTSADFKRTL